MYYFNSWKSVEITLGPNASAISPKIKTAIAGRGGSWQAHPGLALLCTAIYTRPPVYRGLSLADYWAWMRYGRAIHPSPKLRLVPEWNEIDPHQKAVLSDELGVGFTTYFLADVGDFAEYIDTLHFVRVAAPGRLTQLPSKKSGPAKSPDYVAIATDRSLSALECKGTQSGLAALTKAIASGHSQKTNLASGASKLRDGLVAGLFIPQCSSSQDATICIDDPPWEELDELISELPEELTKAAAVQVALARNYSVLGARQIANYLGSTAVEQVTTEGLSEAAVGLAPDSLVNRVRDEGPIYGTNANLSLRFTAERAQVAHERLLKSPNLIETFVELFETLEQGLALEPDASPNHTVKETHAPAIAQLSTPLGFTFSLEALESEQVR